MADDFERPIPLPHAPRAVLFDMDGLMLDSEAVLLDCWRQAARELALELDDALWLSMIGLSDRACHALLRARVAEAQAQALIARLHDLYEPRVQAGIPTRPGIFELLALLDRHEIPRGVATSTWRPRALLKLERSGLLPHFATVTGGDEVAQAKPAPDIYLLAAQRLDVAPEHCLVLEDSGPGVRAALAAGMTAIQVPDLAPPNAEVRALGHRIVASLGEAQALLEAVLGARDSAAERAALR